MKKNIFLWSLYDFANSIIMIVFLFYFSQWIVIDSHKPDWWYNATLIISSVLFIVIAPIFAKKIDATGKKIGGLRVTTAITFVLYFITACITLFAPSHVVWAVILFTLALAVYLLSFVYYTPMMNDLSTDVNKGFVSGMGQGANSLGQVFGLLVTLPFATGALYLFGAPGRAQTLLPSVIIFGILALPMLIFYKENSSVSLERTASSKEYSKITTIIKKILSIKNLAYLFLGYFLFSDALLTFSNNFPIFLEKVHGATDTTKTYLGASILLLAAIGAFIFGKIADKYGRVRTLIAVLIFWCILFPALAFSPSFTVAVILCLIGGLFFGPVWTISRALVAEYTPKEIEASSFSFYTIAERFSTFIGPIVWSIVLTMTASKGVLSYSYGLVALGVLVFAGLIAILKIKAR